MNNSRTKRLKSIIIGQSLVTLAILLIASYLIVYSMGYKVNLISRKIVKTGLIVLSIDIKPDKIFLNNQEKQSKKDVAFQLEPDFYDIKIEKAGYHNWSVRSNVKEELVNYYNNIILFKQDAQVLELTDPEMIDRFSNPADDLVENSPKGLLFNDYEIWLEEKLIARYSEPISSVSWYPGYHYVSYQKGNQIWAIEDTGYNNTLLVELPLSDKAEYYYANRGKDIYINQSNQYYKANIR